MKKEIKGILLTATTSFLWGTLPIFLKMALAFAPTFAIVFFRFTLAFCSLWLIYRFYKPEVTTILKRPPFLAIVAGLCLATNYYSYLHGLNLTTASNAQIVIQSGIISLILIGVFFFQEKLTLIQTMGIGLSMIGFYVFHNSQNQGVELLNQKFLVGNLWILLGGISWAAYVALQKLLNRDYFPQSITLIVYLIATLVFLPLCPFSIFTQISAGQWILLIYLGLNTVLAYGALAEAVKLIPAWQVSAIISLNPIITLITLAAIGYMGWMTPETLSFDGYLGACMVVTGVIVINLWTRTKENNDTQ